MQATAVDADCDLNAATRQAIRELEADEGHRSDDAATLFKDLGLWRADGRLVRAVQARRPKRADKRGKDMTKLRDVVTFLIEEQPLPPAYGDHPLKGD